MNDKVFSAKRLGSDYCERVVTEADYLALEAELATVRDALTYDQMRCAEFIDEVMHKITAMDNLKVELKAARETITRLEALLKAHQAR